jgi:hypothetical protein
MREEYLEQMLTAKNEIENRCVILKNKKDDQMEELQLLSEEQTRNELATNAEQLAGKLETCQEMMKTTVDRLNGIMRAIQHLSPVLSSEEEEWTDECKKMNANLAKLSRCAEMTRTKHENSVLAAPPDIQQQRTHRPPLVGSKQLIRLRARLKEQDGSIENLVSQVQTLSMSVGS